LAGVVTEDADSRASVVQLAELIRRLLLLDKPGAAERRRRVPADLLSVVGRALGHEDPPFASLADFRRSLERFGRVDPTMLAAVFWRAAPVRPATRPYAVVLPGKNEPGAKRSTDDRRVNMPPSSELRRYLRETERELYEARIQAKPAAEAHERGVAGRFLRVSTGIAATVAGAVLGTFMAFILAGSLENRSQVASTNIAPPPAMAAAQVDQPKPASNSDRPIHTTRTVQPLLLSAAVGADVFSPSFGPRGRALLFHTGRESAPLMRASVSDTGEIDHIETLLDDGAANYHVTMSPDAMRIAYDSDRDGVRGVYVANADGTNAHRISGNGYGAVPSWSPDGERVAFVKAEPRRPQIWNIWIVDLRSGHLQRVTSHEVGQPLGASWFPDGQRLAYSVEDRLMVADLRSGLARGYRSPRAGSLVRTPAVSPDGRRIVFQVQSDGVWLLDVDRARMRRILEDATAEEFVWSPDGDAIAYHARKGGSYGLWRLAMNTSGN
jgi:Tol biopolymer transport system component